MKTIKFFGDYLKLHGQKIASLIAVSRIRIDKNTPQELIEYDTARTDGTYCELKEGIYLQLVFLGNKGIPFCTIRNLQPAHRLEYYKASIGKTFEIVIEPETAEKIVPIKNPEKQEK